MSVYDNIDRLAKQRGISRRQLARMSGIKYSTLASCFARRVDPFPRKYAMAVAWELGVTVDMLYGKPVFQLDIEAIDELGDLIDSEVKRRDEVNRIFNELNVRGQLTMIERGHELTELLRYTSKDVQI